MIWIGSRRSRLNDHAARFARRPRWRVYAKRILCVALCQGAALHYVDGQNGIKDFDLWTFYAEHPEGPFPTAAGQGLTSASRALAGASPNPMGATTVVAST